MSGVLRFDVAVVGAGPSGAIAAMTLAQVGLRVAIFEKCRLPRAKTCGGGLLRRAITQLDLDLEEVIEAECFVAELYHHHPSLHFSAVSEFPVVSMVMREKFDQLLVNAAVKNGAQLFEATPVLAVEPSPNRVRLVTAAGEIEAQFVIAADGVNSLVARQCNFPSLEKTIGALECEITVEPERWTRFQEKARFDFGFIPWGYGWVFPKRDHLSVGVLTTQRGCCNLHREYERYLTAVGLESPIKEVRHGYLIPLKPRRKLFSQPRILLAGDAAGLVDPVLAEGISSALLSGRWAAAAVLGGLQYPDTVMRRYQKMLTRSVLTEFRAGRGLALGLYRCPRIRAWLFRRYGQKLADYVARVAQGKASYRDALLCPGNYLKLMASK